MTYPNQANVVPPQPAQPLRRTRPDACCRQEALQSVTDGAYGAERCVELFIDRLERAE